MTADCAWHIGDSWQDDYEGAINAGLKGIWLNRNGLRSANVPRTASNRDHPSSPTDTHTEIASLSEMMPIQSAP